MTDDRTEPGSRIAILLASPGARRVLTIGLAFACAAFVAATLFAAFCAFTWFKFALFDYGIYTNMIWNSGRGRLFLVLTTRSYLKTHLSFSLALLGPLYYIWDHPFLLSVAQWLMLLAGAACAALAGFRRKLAPCLVMSILLLYVAYPLTQSVMLCEFHGVAGYLLLIPWLYYCLSFKRNLSWVPLVLLLGLREDAFLIALPILAYFAVRDRSPAVWTMLAVSVAYGLLAAFYLFPAVVGRSLMDRRAGCLPSGGILRLFGEPAVVLSKVKALAWVALPAALFVRRGWRAVLTFLSAPVLITLLSKFESQYELKLHYPAAMMACLATAFIEAARPTSDDTTTRGAARAVALSALLAIVTLGAHLYRGYLPLGGKFKAVYARPNAQGVATIRAARSVPKEGILMAPDRLMAFCANRPDITKWQYLSRPERPRDLVFIGLVDLFGRRKDRFREMLDSGGYGLRYVGDSHVLLLRNGDTGSNAELISAIDDSDRTVRFHTTLRHGGDNVSGPAGNSLRHWAPGRQRGPLTIAYGLSVKLPPGNYEAAFRFRHGTSGTAPGVLSLHRMNRPDAITQAGISAAPEQTGQFSTQRLRFELTEKTHVEPRVTAGDTELWLDRVAFRRVGSDQ